MVLKVVGIIGYKNSGKTTLIQALAHELAGRGHEVAVIKHTSHHLDLPGKDTAVLGETVSQVGLISPRGLLEEVAEAGERHPLSGGGHYPGRGLQDG